MGLRFGVFVGLICGCILVLVGTFLGFVLVLSIFGVLFFFGVMEPSLLVARVLGFV